MGEPSFPAQLGPRACPSAAAHCKTTHGSEGEPDSGVGASPKLEGKVDINVSFIGKIPSNPTHLASHAQ